jgi:hypothetical protein
MSFVRESTRNLSLSVRQSLISCKACFPKWIFTFDPRHIARIKRQRDAKRVISLHIVAPCAVTYEVRSANERQNLLC